jgi:hypothetical protein
LVFDTKHVKDISYLDFELFYKLKVKSELNTFEIFRMGVINPADTAWVLVSTGLILLMVII